MQCPCIEASIVDDLETLDELSALPVILRRLIMKSFVGDEQAKLSRETNGVGCTVVAPSPAPIYCLLCNPTICPFVSLLSAIKLLDKISSPRAHTVSLAA